jgi:hypothetical protein
MSVYQKRRSLESGLQEDKAEWFGNGNGKEKDQDGFESRTLRKKGNP